MSMVFALVLLGCADDGGACERLTTLPERYDAKALCLAQQEAALESDIALRSDYPTILVRCVAHAGKNSSGHARLAMQGYRGAALAARPHPNSSPEGEEL